MMLGQLCNMKNTLTMLGRPVVLATLLVTLVTQTCALTEAEIQILRDRGQANIKIENGKITFQSNGIPDHDYGPFPGEGNQNTVQEHNFTMTVDLNPNKANQPSCLNMGEIGMIINGVPYFNPYNIFMENAVEGPTAEVFDNCLGHPQEHGVYHYHQIPSCVHQGKPNELLGVSLDGYPIYGPNDENGMELTSEDLDICHGRMYNGQYQYHMTTDYPYLQGCYMGTPSERIRPPRPGNGGNDPTNGNDQPPPDGENRPPPPMGEDRCTYAIEIEEYSYTGDGIDETLLKYGKDAADKVSGTAMLAFISLIITLLCLY